MLQLLATRIQLLLLLLVVMAAACLGQGALEAARAGALLHGRVRSRGKVRRLPLSSAPTHPAPTPLTRINHAVPPLREWYEWVLLLLVLYTERGMHKQLAMLGRPMHPQAPPQRRLYLGRHGLEQR